MKKLTNAERELLVQDQYEKIRTRLLAKVSKEMKTNPDYKNLLSLAEQSNKAYEDYRNLRKKTQKLRDKMNNVLSDQFCEFKCIRYSDITEVDFEVAEPYQVRREIESTLVKSYLMPDFDFDKLMDELLEKFGVAE